MIITVKERERERTSCAESCSLGSQLDEKENERMPLPLTTAFVLYIRNYLCSGGSDQKAGNALKLDYLIFLLKFAQS